MAMLSVGEALARETANLPKFYAWDDLPPVSEPEARADYVERFLAKLPPTDEVQAALDGVHERLTLLPDEPSRERRKLRDDQVRLGRWLRWAEQRDAIQAERPAGCLCLGLGGFERIVLLGADGEPWPTWRRFCGCPEGGAAGAQQLAFLSERERLVTERRLAKLWAQPELAAYRTCTLETYPQRTEQQRRVVAVVRRWLDETAWLYLWGPSGRGKTGLAVALLRALIERGASGLVVNVVDLLQALRDTYSTREAMEADERDVLASLRDVDVLVLDDLGVERRTDWTAEKLYAVLNGRYNALKRTILTSNYDLDSLQERLGDEFAGQRLPSRIKGRCGDRQEYVVCLSEALPDLRVGAAL